MTKYVEIKIWCIRRAIADALDGFSNPMIWLIAIAVMMAVPAKSGYEANARISGKTLCGNDRLYTLLIPNALRTDYIPSNS